MKILLINGSPRKGNTMTALKALKEGIEKIDGAEVNEIVCEEKTIIPCRACNACMSMSRCILADDSPQINAAIEEADAIVFATPVYWWGVTAQMKLVIDKLYAREVKLKGNKKVGTIVIGEASTDDPEYELVKTQIRCISDYMDWETVFAVGYSANKPSDLKENEEALAQIQGLAKLLV